MLVARGRIQLDRDVGVWVRQALAHERARELPVTAQVAVRAALLDERFPGDPADRLIYAAALEAGAKLITKDSELRAFDSVTAVW